MATRTQDAPTSWMAWMSGEVAAWVIPPMNSTPKGWSTARGAAVGVYFPVIAAIPGAGKVNAARRISPITTRTTSQGMGERIRFYLHHVQTCGGTLGE